MLDKKKSFIMSVADRKQVVKSTEETSNDKDLHKMDNTRTSAVILATGLLIHNIFEGMSIGLQPNETQLFLMMLAVCSHKVIVAFSLGLSFFQAGWWDCTSISVMVTFTVAGPIGTLIGFVIASGDGTEVLSAIFMSITSGTFL